MRQEKDKASIFLIVAIGITLASLLSGIPAVEGRDVISNSADWRDVYSTMLYGNLGGASPHFLTATAHGPIMLYEIPKNNEGTEIITSADKPFYIGYEALMNSRGYSDVEEIILETANLELARKLPQINKFIILDDAYGYNALAVGPYATAAKYYVLFANRRNIDDISAFLSTKSVEDIIIYGQTDREVRNALAQYNPEVINSESGSRFENNMAIVDKYAEIGSIKQVILTNGEFIESSMMNGNEPVLFIGKNNVPAEIKEYIHSRGIEIGVLIGNELIGTATDIRRDVGISVFVKFARGSRIPGGTINPVEDLDRFPMPSYQLSMSITSVSYNQATGELEVTYKNNVDLASYFKSTITIKGDNDETLVVDGDEETVFIDGEESKTVIYSKTKDISPENIKKGMTAEVYTIYGESKTALENVIRGTFPIEIIDVRDEADIEIEDLVYDKSRGTFYVTIKNIGKTEAYTDVELVELWIDGEYVTVSSDETEKIDVGKSKDIPVKIRLEDEDLLDDRNSKITVRALYGERMHALIKAKTKEFDLKIRTFNATYAMISLAVIAAIIIILLLSRKRRKKCKRCRTSNERDAKICKKCGHHL